MSGCKQPDILGTERNQHEVIEIIPFYGMRNKIYPPLKLCFNVLPCSWVFLNEETVQLNLQQENEETRCTCEIILYILVALLQSRCIFYENSVKFSKSDAFK